jgi:peptidoglycan/xylan/chitin deacetylase (PgdA/CDA1 family)
LGRGRKNVLVLIALMAFLLVLVLYLQPGFLRRIIAGLNPDVLFQVDTSEKVLALTIDDGPHASVTPEILDVLRMHSAKATFFLLGERIPGNEALPERMRREGHELANHMQRDFPTILLSRDEFERQLLHVDSLIGPTEGKPKWFRPGSGWFSPAMLRRASRHGYGCCLGSIYPHDTKIRNVATISCYLEKRAFPGGVIILHDGSPDRIRTAKVLRRVLPKLKDRGYRIVTVTELYELGSSR